MQVKSGSREIKTESFVQETHLNFNYGSLIVNKPNNLRTGQYIRKGQGTETTSAKSSNPVCML